MGGGYHLTFRNWACGSSYMWLGDTPSQWGSQAGRLLFFLAKAVTWLILP